MARIPKLEVFDATNETNDNRNTHDDALLANHSASNHRMETGVGNSSGFAPMANEHRILMGKYFQLISHVKNGTKITVNCVNCQRNMRSDSTNYSSIIDHLKVCISACQQMQYFQNY